MFSRGLLTVHLYVCVCACMYVCMCVSLHCYSFSAFLFVYLSCSFIRVQITFGFVLPPLLTASSFALRRSCGWSRGEKRCRNMPPHTMYTTFLFFFSCPFSFLYFVSGPSAHVFSQVQPATYLIITHHSGAPSPSTCSEIDYIYTPRYIHTNNTYRDLHDTHLFFSNGLAIVVCSHHLHYHCCLSSSYFSLLVHSTPGIITSL